MLMFKFLSALLFSSILFSNISAQNSGWEQLNVGINEYLTSVYFVNNDVGYMTSNFGSVFKTETGGNTWAVESNVAFTLKSNHFISHDTGIVAGRNIYKTIDGGNNWVEVYSSGFYDFKKVQYISEDTVYAVADIGGYLVSFDGGDNWISLGSPGDSNSGFFLIRIME